MRRAVGVSRDVQAQFSVERQGGSHIGQHQFDHFQLRIDGHETATLRHPGITCLERIRHPDVCAAGRSQPA
jgi:hypothetical protein